MDKINLMGPVLSGKVEWYDDDSYICPVNVSNALVGKGDVEVHINSFGGDVFAGIAIHNILKSHSGEVHVYIDGLAASAASIIAQAGDKIKMGSGSMMMIHNAWTYAKGNAEQLRKTADDLDKIGESLHEIYMNRFVGDKQELIDLLKDESYLTAEECITFGFADADSDADADEEEKNTDVKASLFNKYREKINNKIETEEDNNSNQSFFMGKFRKENFKNGE